MVNKTLANHLKPLKISSENLGVKGALSGLRKFFAIESPAI